MFGKKDEFPPPEMPGVCLKCGSRGPLKNVKFEYRYATTASTLITFVSPLLGAIYSRRMSYKPELQVCTGCEWHLKRARNITAVSALLFLPSLLLIPLLVDYSAFCFLIPFVYLVAAYAFHGVVRGRGTPKPARVDNLIFSVPDYGPFVFFEREQGGAAARPRRQAAPAGPKLNRSVCDGCGFINFPNVLECKKCRAPLGRVAAFQAAATRG